MRRILPFLIVFAAAFAALAAPSPNPPRSPTPSPTPTASPSPTATHNPTPTPTATFTPTPTATFTPTPTPTATYTPTPTPTPRPSPTPTATPTPCNNAPVITSPLTANGEIGIAFSYRITATNTTSQTNYTATPLPPGLSRGTGGNRNLISGTPTTSGITNVTITVSNGQPCNTTSATLVITICEQAANITSALTATATVGSPFSYQIRADNSPTTFDDTEVPQGLTMDNTPGLISGTPTALGTFPVTISATNTSPTVVCSPWTATATLILTINWPPGVIVPPFPGEVDVFNWGSTPPPPTATIPFPNASTDNYFVLYWNTGGSTTNQGLADSSNGGLTRNNDPTVNSSPVAMSYNPYDPTLGTTPRPDLNVWRGNPMPPNVNTAGQFGDPRASW